MMILKISFLLFLFSSSLQSLELDKTIGKYTSNTFFDLREINIHNVEKIVNKNSSCVLFKNNTNIYCVLNDLKKIKVQLLLKNKDLINLLIINSKYLTKKELKLGATLTEKYSNCIKENEKLHSNEIVNLDKINILKAKLKEQNNSISFYINEITKLKEQIKYLNIKKNNMLEDMRKKCQKERTEIISIMSGKLYKPSSEYTIESQLMIELEKNRKNIKEVQDDYLKALEKNDLLMKEIEELKKNNVNSKEFIE